VKVYLLFVNDRESFFYSDESETDESEAEAPTAPASGWRGWFEDRWHRFRKAWHQSETGLAGWARRNWDWLHSFFHPDESFLVRLRATERVDLHHPASRHGDAVAETWHGYLGRKWRRHIVWLSLNAAIAPAALVLLWPLPGPNLIGYWFAYRAIHHWLIVRGLGAVRKGRTPTRYHAESSLDQPIERDQDGKARHPAIKGRGVRLDEYVSWTSTSQGPDASAGKAAVRELKNPEPDPDSQPLPPAPEMPNDG
jgi:Mitochondrial K+-H+ exchange-related